MGPIEAPNAKAMPALTLGDIWVQSVEHSGAQLYALLCIYGKMLLKFSKDLM